MARAPKICPVVSCSCMVPCPDHTPKPWASSQRSTRTISGSRQQKRAARIMRAHDRTCHRCGLPGAMEVDHLIPLSEGGADDDGNLRPIHIECHKIKTQAEANRARNPRS